MPIRILQVLTIMNRGGAEAMIMNYYRNIDRSKIQFDFLLHRHEPGAFDDEIISLGGRIFKFDPINPLSYRSYKKKLNAFFTSHPEYTIVHSHLNALSYIVLGVAKNKGIKIRISHSHTAIQSGIFLRLFHGGVNKKNLLKEFVQHQLRYKVRRVSTHNFACGEKAGRWLFGLTGDFTIIHNAIDTSKFTYNPGIRSTIRTKLNLSQKKIMGHVGRFSVEKNHLYLIEIFKIVLTKNNDFHLLLIGDGNLMSNAIKLAEKYNISENISFLGIREDISELLQAMDIFVFPSIYEGLPVTLIEAQSSGLKILASNNISGDVNLTGMINFMDITSPPEIWAEKVLEELNYERKDTSSIIKIMKYDIQENALELQNFYLDQSK